MAEREFYISKTPDEALKIIQHFIIKKSSTGQVVGQTKRTIGENKVIVFVMEKYYLRTGNRASLTVTLDNFEGNTKVHVIASGSSGSPIIRFDWGVSDNFMESVENALEPWMVP